MIRIEVFGREENANLEEEAHAGEGGGLLAQLQKRSWTPVDVPKFSLPEDAAAHARFLEANKDPNRVVVQVMSHARCGFLRHQWLNTVSYYVFKQVP